MISDFSGLYPLHTHGTSSTILAIKHTSRLGHVFPVIREGLLLVESHCFKVANRSLFLFAYAQVGTRQAHCEIFPLAHCRLIQRVLDLNSNLYLPVPKTGQPKQKPSCSVMISVFGWLLSPHGVHLILTSALHCQWTSTRISVEDCCGPECIVGTGRVKSLHCEI